MVYSEDGLLQQFVDPLGHTNQLTYDARGRLIKDEDPVGEVRPLFAPSKPMVLQSLPPPLKVASARIKWNYYPLVPFVAA